MKKIKNFIIKQQDDIAAYGIDELFKKIIILFKIIFLIPVHIFAFFPLIIIRFLRPLIVIRIGRIPTINYGHLAYDPSVYYCKKKLKISHFEKKHLDLFYIHYDDRIYNKQLVKMWKRKLNFLPGLVLAPIEKINKLIPGWEIHSIQDVTSFVPYDKEFELEKCKPLEFTQEEENYGKNILSKFGLKNTDKFVCFAIRDSAHNRIQKKTSRNNNWSYHDYRHWDLDNFFLAAEELTKKGYYVFRMGVYAEKEFKSNNPKIIDYVNSDLKSDFMDVFLGAKCSFCLSTSFGFDEVPNLFRKPIIYLILPFGHFRSYSDRFIILTKHHYLKKEKRRLTLSEIFSRGLAFIYDTKIFNQKGIELVDNTPEEIKDVVIEMHEYLEKKQKLSDEDENLQKKFKSLYMRNYLSTIKNIEKVQSELTQRQRLNLKMTHGKIRSRYSTKFLNHNKDWLN